MLIIIIILLFGLFLLLKNEKQLTVGYSVNNCIYSMSENLKRILNENNIPNTNNADIILHIPCSYDNINGELNKFNLDYQKDNKIFIVSNADELVAKERLWKHLINYYGSIKTLELMPMSYITYNKKDMERFHKEFNKDKLYILKKNIQRQNGIVITNDLNDFNNLNKEYVIIQELLQNPYLINNRKINMRVYILFINNYGKKNVYVYNDGFLYYTKDYFKENSTNLDNNITTGYIDRTIYDTHPLTHTNLKTFLDSNRNLTKEEKNILDKGFILSNYLFNNINLLVKKIFIPFLDKLGLDHLYSFQLFGMDIAVNKNLQPQVMEINKGPDLNSKDERDGNIKKSLIRDILKTTNIIPNINNQFIKVL